MTKKNKLSSQKRLAIAGFFAIFIALLIMISSVPAQAGTGHQQETGFTTSINYIPQPTLQTNITWNTFYHSWKPTEYSTGTGNSNQTLNANPSNTYTNYITVNPEDINATGSLTNNGIGVNKTAWEQYITYPLGSAPQTIKNSKGIVTDSFNTSTTKTQSLGIYGAIPITYYPSSNIQYDYLTIIVGLKGASITGANANILFQNGTGNSQTESNTILPGQIQYVSYSLLQLEKMDKISFNTTGKGYSNSITPVIRMTTPTDTTTEDYTLTIYGMAMTTEPYTLGTQTTSKGVITTPDNFTGIGIKLSTFNPDFIWNKITNNGYTVSVSQSMQNETISQTSINDGVYTEQATYQGQLTMPTAPDLTYSNSFISMKMNITGKQFLVANMNGESYINTVQSQNNGTYIFGNVNPNSDNTVIIEVKYTSAQWTASSGAPSIWSIAGIEYYWYIFLGGALGLIGLGTSKHAQTLRVGKK